MTEPFKKCLRLILASELEPGENVDLEKVGARITDSPHDDGGRTNDGILESEFHEWLRKHKQPIRKIETMTARERNAIYEENYYDPCRCGELPFPLDYVLMDYAVHSGVFQATKDLQRAVGAKADGKFGDVETMPKVRTRLAFAVVTLDTGFVLRGAHAVSWSLLDQRFQLLAKAVKNDHGDAHNILGWSRRVMRLVGLVISDAWTADQR